VATHIRYIINKFLEEKYNNATIKQQIREKIYTILDKKLHPHIDIGKIYKNKLFLYTDCSLVNYEINLLRDKILEEVKIIKKDIDQIVIRNKTLQK